MFWYQIVSFCKIRFIFKAFHFKYYYVAKKREIQTLFHWVTGRFPATTHTPWDERAITGFDFRVSLAVGMSQEWLPSAFFQLRHVPQISRGTTYGAQREGAVILFAYPPLDWSKIKNIVELLLHQRS